MTYVQVRDFGLSVPLKQRRRRSDFRPFGKTPAMPLVVLWYLMELRQVIAKKLHGFLSYSRFARLAFLLVSQNGLGPLPSKY